jgi:aldoxime dehydratase
VSRPANWQPPYPAFWPQFGADASVVCGYFAIQGDDEHARREFAEWIAEAFAADYGPGASERGHFTDSTRLRNDLQVGYWRDPDDYRRWREGETFTRFWNSPLRAAGKAGYWNETLILPSAYFEALFSSAHMAGASRLANRIGCPVDEHAYWGAARDRIPALATNDSTGHSRAPLAAREIASVGRRVRIVPPAHLCMIHTAQNWSACSDAQRKFYLQEVQPTLVQGLTYLTTHAGEIGCAASRYVHELAADGANLERTFGMCYFLTFKHLEDWAREHPTHLEIYGSFMRLAQQFDFDVQLRLWHQVAVLPPGNPPFEYVNCHPRTGLLPYFG